jgi:hypothetical protein
LFNDSSIEAAGGGKVQAFLFDLKPDQNTFASLHSSEIRQRREHLSYWGVVKIDFFGDLGRGRILVSPSAWRKHFSIKKSST